MKFKSNLFLTITIIVAFALTSCGSSNNSIIATAVALTVQAQNTQPASVTDTPLAPRNSPPSREYVHLKRSSHKYSFRQYSCRGAFHSHTFCNLLSRIHGGHQILYSERHVHQ